MAIKISSSIVINNSREVTLGGLNSDPGGVSAGAIHFNRGLGVVRGWNGTSWTNLTQGASTTEIYGVGDNPVGELGNNTTFGGASPILVVGGFTDWVSVSTKGNHSGGIRANGTAWTWGQNTSGGLGDNTVVNKSSPVSVVGGFTDWIQIGTALYNNTIGLRANGTAWTWGRNGYGQLGTNDAVYRSSPTSVAGGFTDWTQVSAGSRFAVGIRTNGQLWSWGRNQHGQLGSFDLVNRSSPISVVGGYTDWIDISAGTYHNSAIRSNGTAWCWGYNDMGQLGIGTTTKRSSPTSVLGGFSNWVQLNSGARCTGAIKSDGTAWTWGFNFSGQLGINLGGAGTYRSSPVSVVGGYTDWVQISAESDSMHGIRANGTAWAWGSNFKGQLGDGGSESRSSPVSVAGLGNWIQVSSGNSHALLIRSTT